MKFHGPQWVDDPAHRSRRVLLEVHSKHSIFSPRLPALMLLLAMTAWGAMSLRTGFDYDEVEHAHALWRVAQGDVPFYDFLEVHPPFFWKWMKPVTRVMPERFESLYIWRF